FEDFEIISGDVVNRVVVAIDNAYVQGNQFRVHYQPAAFIDLGRVRIRRRRRLWFQDRWRWWRTQLRSDAAAGTTLACRGRCRLCNLRRRRGGDGSSGPRITLLLRQAGLANQQSRARENND